MLSKFFRAVKPKEYSVQVLKDTTSQSAVRRIKRSRAKAPLRKIATLTLVLAFLMGGAVTATAATAVTAKQAKANIISDFICISPTADNSGSWSGGANLFGVLGGRSQYSMTKVTRNSVPSDGAYAGQPTSDFGKGSGAPDGGAYLTAYEKYGMDYPIYDAWVPAYSDKTVAVHQVNSHAGSYSDASGKLPLLAGNGNNVDPGSSPLVTSDMGNCYAFLPSVEASIANMISTIPRFAMGVSISLYGSVYGSSISNPNSVLYSIGQGIDNLITKPGGLRDVLFLPFMPLILIIGAIWVGYEGIIKKSATVAWQSAVWMVIAVALGTVFLAKPTLISGVTDQVVVSVQGAINEATLAGAQANDMCDIGQSPMGANDRNSLSVRETQCTIWESTIYTTWATGQFGQSANASNSAGSVLTQDAGRHVLNDNGYQIFYGSQNAKPAKTWPQFMIDREVTNKSLEISEVAWSQLSGQNGAAVNPSWAGSIGMISSSILMFFGAGATSMVLVVYSFALLTYQLTMVTAVLISPFFFLLGIIPGFGRRVLLRYAEILTNLIVKRVVTSMMLSFYLIFYNLIIGAAQANYLLLKIIILFALGFFFIAQRGKFINMFAENINFGGNKSIGLPGNKAMATAAGVGAGLLGGGLIGGLIVGNKMRKNNKDLEGKVGDIKLEGGSSPTADLRTAPGGRKSSEPLKTLGKAVNAVDDGKRAKKMAEGAMKAMDKAKPKVETKTLADGSKVTTVEQQATVSASSSSSASVGATVAPQGAQAAARAGTKAIPAFPGGIGGAAKAASTLSGGAGIGGAGATVAPAGAAAATTGASAAAAAAPAAAGAASAAAAGAAAGSVVPVVGTAIGGAVGVASFAAKKKKDDEAKKEGK